MKDYESLKNVYKHIENLRTKEESLRLQGSKRTLVSNRTAELGVLLRSLYELHILGSITAELYWRLLVTHINDDYGGQLPRQLRKPKVRAVLIRLARKYGKIPAFLERTPSYRLPPVTPKPEWRGGPIYATAAPRKF